MALKALKFALFPPLDPEEEKKPDKFVNWWELPPQKLELMEETGPFANPVDFLPEDVIHLMVLNAWAQRRDPMRIKTQSEERLADRVLAAAQKVAANYRVDVIPKSDFEAVLDGLLSNEFWKEKPSVIRDLLLKTGVFEKASTLRGDREKFVRDWWRSKRRNEFPYGIPVEQKMDLAKRVANQVSATVNEVILIAEEEQVFGPLKAVSLGEQVTQAWQQHAKELGVNTIPVDLVDDTLDELADRFEGLTREQIQALGARILPSRKDLDCYRESVKKTGFGDPRAQLNIVSKSEGEKTMQESRESNSPIARFAELFLASGLVQSSSEVVARRKAVAEAMHPTTLAFSVESVDTVRKHQGSASSYSVLQMDAQLIRHAWGYLIGDQQEKHQLKGYLAVKRHDPRYTWLKSLVDRGIQTLEQLRDLVHLRPDPEAVEQTQESLVSELQNSPNGSGDSQHLVKADVFVPVLVNRESIEGLAENVSSVSATFFSAHEKLTKNAHDALSRGDFQKAADVYGGLGELCTGTHRMKTGIEDILKTYGALLERLG